MNKLLSRAAVPLYALLWLLVLLSGLFLCLRGVIRRSGLYYDAYVRMDIQSRIGISAEDCTAAVYRLVEYMEGEAGDIQLTVTEDGEAVAMYNRQEIDHMRDVRALYQGFRSLMRISFAVGALCMLLLPALCRPLWPAVRGGFFAAWLLFAAAVLALGVWVLVDFNGFWTQFHYLFFDNDLWLMDPAVCRMIRICPLELFYGIVLRTGGLFLLLFCAVPLLLFTARRLGGKKPARAGEETR